MKAVILAGGEGTRLRPLTLQTPKPVVPVVDRPFLAHQIALLRSAGVNELVFSLGYRPDRIEAVFGDGSAFGVRIHYVVEEAPLGTGGAVRNALPLLDERTLVLNGDILAAVELRRLVARHVAARARATILLTPVANPAAYGLVATAGAERRVLRFIEKPQPQEITSNDINAGIYVIETEALELMPAGVNVSIERSFFPALLARGDLVLGPLHDGYWIDIGTPEKYLQVHRDILHHRFAVALDGAPDRGGFVHPSASVSPDAELTPPFYLGPGCRLAAGAHVGPDAVLTADVRVEAGAAVRDSVVWSEARLGSESSVEGCLLASGVSVGRAARLSSAILGEGSIVSDYSRIRPLP